MQGILLLLLCLFLVACDSGTHYAPVTEVNTIDAISQLKQPVVLAQEPVHLAHAHAVTWQWPTQGKRFTAFSHLDKGLRINGRAGDPIHAAAAGTIVYSGEGLKRYGKLIIIKHNNNYLSAYAHNRRVLVKEGEWVKQGQKIAEMGHTGTQSTMLYFEIRRAGKPIDPLSVYRNKKNWGERQ